MAPFFIFIQNCLKMKDINGIPVYRAVVDDTEATGMELVSFVDDCAVSVDFLAVAKSEPMQFSVQSEEQRKVLGVVMRPDFPIYRETIDGLPFYIVYDAQTIHKMAEKFFATMNVNNVDTDHSFELVDGVTLTQAFFKNVEKGINPAGFEELPDDTLFFEYHITSDDIWAGIKNGTWKGLSLAGHFNIEPVTMQKQEPKANVLDEIETLIDKINNKIKQ